MSTTNFQIFKNFLSQQECQELLDCCIKESMKANETLIGSGKNVNVKLISPTAHPLLKKFIDKVQLTNKLTIGYKLYNIEEIGALVNFNEYTVGKEYPWHTDGTSEKEPNSDIKLTGILNISTKPYNGGNFEIFSGSDDKLINGFIRENFISGSLLIMKSHLFHRVTPVLSGTRYSLSFWFVGPKFK